MTNLTLPPYDLLAEQAVLGSLMLSGFTERSFTVFKSLKEESFYNRQHQVIFATMVELFQAKKMIDIITVSDRLENKGQLENCGGLAYIAELAKNTPSTINIKAYAEIIRDKAAERYTLGRLQEASQMILDKLTMSTADKLSAIQSIFTQIDDYHKTGKTLGLKSLKSIADRWTESLDKRLSNDPSVRGMSTGIDALDSFLGPKKVVRGSLVVIGARPKSGKTTLELFLARHCALVEKQPALLFSLEMQDEQILEKVLAQEAGVSTDMFYDEGLGNGNDFALVMAKLNELIESENMFIDDTAAITLSHIRSEARRLAKQLKRPLGFIMVDYLTLMEKEKTKGEQRNDLAYGDITKGLKSLAKELNCVVILLTQLNRKVEDRGDKRPLPSDSRDTGQIEQDCDYWLGIYRDSLYNEKADPTIMELSLELNRHGASKKRFYLGVANGNIKNIDQASAHNSANPPQEPKRKRKYAKATDFN